MSGISIDGKTKLYGVIGNPVKHSFSPRMHSTAFQLLGINAVYLPFHIITEQLPNLLNAFTITGVQGFNITLPHKENIVPYLDLLSNDAEVLQSVNTVIKTETGWKGYNTDGSGFIRSLSDADISIRGRKVLIVGAGGAARSIAVALAREGVADMIILNRTSSKAESLATLLHDISSGISVKTGYTQGDHPDIVINTTSVGMKGNQCPIPDEIVLDCDQIIDIIYNPSQTPLLKKAEERSIPYLNGLDMLLYQGVEAFEIWTGQTAPIAAMRESLIASIYG